MYVQRIPLYINCLHNNGKPCHLWKGANTTCQVICEDDDPLPTFASLTDCLVLFILLEPSPAHWIISRHKLCRETILMGWQVFSSCQWVVVVKGRLFGMEIIGWLWGGPSLWTASSMDRWASAKFYYLNKDKEAYREPIHYKSYIHSLAVSPLIARLVAMHIGGYHVSLHYI